MSARFRVSPSILMAIECSYGSLKEFLDHEFQKADWGWYIDPSVVIEFDSIKNDINTLLTQRSLPFRLGGLKASTKIQGLLPLVANHLGLKTYGEYICGGRIGARKRRAIRLHLLLRKFWPDLLPLAELMERYRISFHDDPCSARDALIVMNEYPHLFICVMEDRWSSLTNQSKNIELPDREYEESDNNSIDSDQSFGTSTSAVSTLVSLLDNFGPMRFTDLRNRALELLPEISKSSIGPILLTGAFTRLAPGLYGLHKHAKNIANTGLVLDDMLAVDQCRWFVQGRRAGCFYGEFAAWNMPLELELCRWAERTNLDSIIFDSLLSVIDPTKWTASIGDREYWRKAKTNRARYLLDQPTPSLDHDPPTLDRLLAAAIKANANGGINWMIINRVIGKRVEPHWLRFNSSVARCCRSRIQGWPLAGFSPCHGRCRSNDRVASIEARARWQARLDGHRGSGNSRTLPTAA